LLTEKFSAFLGWVGFALALCCFLFSLPDAGLAASAPSVRDVVRRCLAASRTPHCSFHCCLIKMLCHLSFPFLLCVCAQRDLCRVE
jgi:hypothetical protein